MIVGRRGERSRAPFARYQPGVSLAIAALVLALLAVSLWTVLETSSGALVLMWCAAWGLGAGIAGWHLRSWSWPGSCPAAML